MTKYGTASGASGNWNYYQPAFTTNNAVPNVAWQGTTSNASYNSVKNVLSAQN